MKIPKSTFIFIIFALSLTLLLFAGFILDSKGFLVNLIASAISITLTVTLINWLMVRQRRSQWKSVRSQIITALLSHIGNMTSEYATGIEIRKNKYDLIAFVTDTGKGYSTPKQETASALKKMAEIMKETPKMDNAREQAERLHKVIEWDVGQICNVLLPRIMAMDTDEPEFVHVLSELDNANREWVNQYIMDKEISSGEQYEAAAVFLERMADVYHYIVDHADTV